MSKNTFVTGLGVFAVGYEGTAISLTLLIVLLSLHITGEEETTARGSVSLFRVLGHGDRKYSVRVAIKQG